VAANTLGLVPEFGNDPTRQVVETTIAIAGSIRQNLVPADLRPNYARFVQKVYGARAHQLGWTPKPGESDDARLLRPDLVGLVANAGEDQALIGEAKALASKWLDDRRAIAPEMAEVVLETAAHHSGRDLYDRLLVELKKATDPRQREQILDAMGSFRDPEIVKENFNLILTGAVDTREAFPLVTQPLGDPRTEAVPFELVRDNHDRLVKVLPRGVLGETTAILPVVGRRFCTAERGQEVEAFFRDRSAKAVGGARILAQTVEQIGQ
jgi:alanyl aminopeptidase